MAITYRDLPRSFSFTQNRQEIVLADPSPSMTPEEVMEFYAGTYPELTTATLKGPEIKDDTVRFSFVTTIGTKG